MSRFSKSKGPGQPGQWLRVCASCEWIYLGSRDCPKCSFAHYGAPFVYDGWIPALWKWLAQTVTGKSVRYL